MHLGIGASSRHCRYRPPCHFYGRSGLRPILLAMYWCSQMNLSLAAASPPGEVTKAFLLFQAFTVLMVLFVLVITLMVLRRWFQRRYRRLKRDTTPQSDPWKEAANRIKPYDRT